MKLSIRERLVLLSILPAQGNFITLKIVRKLRENLSFSGEEIERYKFIQSEGKVTWDGEVEQMKPIEIGTQAKVIIGEALKQLDETKKLRDEHYSIYEKFVTEGK